MRLSFLVGITGDETSRSPQIKAGSCAVCVLLGSALTDRSELSAHNIFLSKKIPVPSAQIQRVKKQSFDLAYGFFLNPPYALTYLSQL